MAKVKGGIMVWELLQFNFFLCYKNILKFKLFYCFYLKLIFLVFLDYFDELIKNKKYYFN